MKNLSIQNAKARLNIHGLWRHFGFPGESKASCRCPWRDDNNASFSVNAAGTLFHDFATGELRYTLPDREGTVYWLAWHPKEARLAVARDNGDIAIWDLAKIDRQLTDLGLGFARQ